MPTHDTPLRISVICTGNICRSPMAEVVLRHYLDADPLLKGNVEVSSAGTANWHVGEPMDPRARGALDRANYRAAASLGAYADADYLNRHDYVVVMTRQHLEEVSLRLTNESCVVLLWRNLTQPTLNLDVEDPYYGDDASFDACLATIVEGANVLIDVLGRHVARRAANSAGSTQCQLDDEVARTGHVG